MATGPSLDLQAPIYRPSCLSLRESRRSPRSEAKLGRYWYLVTGTLLAGKTSEETNVRRAASDIEERGRLFEDPRRYETIYVV
jgi:hypothetical protein